MPRVDYSSPSFSGVSGPLLNCASSERVKEGFPWCSEAPRGFCLLGQPRWTLILALQWLMPCGSVLSGRLEESSMLPSFSSAMSALPWQLWTLADVSPVRCKKLLSRGCALSGDVCAQHQSLALGVRRVCEYAHYFGLYSDSGGGILLKRWRSCSSL